MQSGNFTISLLKAELYRDTELFGAMDPYVVIKIGSQKFTSAICYKGGQHPTWIDTFNCKCDDLHMIDFEVWDHEMLKTDDLIGSGKFAMSMLDKTTMKFVGNIALEYLGQPAGALKLMVTVKPDAAVAGAKTGEKTDKAGVEKTGEKKAEKTGEKAVVEKAVEKIGKENAPQHPQAFCPICNNTGQIMKKGNVVPCTNCQVTQGQCSKCFGTGFNQKKGKPCKCQSKNKPSPQFVQQQGLPTQKSFQQQGYPGQQQQYQGQQYPGMKPF